MRELGQAPRGRGRGRGRGRQQQPLGGPAGDTALTTFFPESGGAAGAQQQQQQQQRQDSVRENDEIEAQLGFVRYQEGPERLGWLINMHATSLVDDLGVERSAVDYYFLEADGGTFKSTVLFRPYFYVVCAAGREGDVEAWVARKFERVEAVERVEREDLQMANHLSGAKRQLVKLEFLNVQDLLSVRRELQPLAKRNARQRQVVSAYAEEGEGEVEEAVLELREFDVPYYLRVAIDMHVRVGLWYDVKAEHGAVTLRRRDDLVQRAEPVVLAFDIETTKLPLKFPDAQTDMIMMISYMVDGQGYLITNREVVSQDIEDFEYSPTQEYLGPFTVFNERDEAAVLRRFVDHIRDARPTVVATYNGDGFDWPFVDARARHHGMDLWAETGWRRDEADEYTSRACVHMDCFRWVKRDSYLPVGSHGLKAVTTAKLGYNPMEIDPEDMTRFAAEQPQTLAQYSVSDAVATYYLYMKYVHPFIFSLCNIIPLNPDEVLRKGSGTLCETLLMVEAFAAQVAIPNKHADAAERVWDGHLVETETYVGGHVEALEAGVFRSDLDMRFRVDPAGAQRLLDELDRALRFSIEVEGKHALEQVVNYDEVRGQIAARLAELRDAPVRTEQPLLYHLDVAAMYPNIILTNRLQPDAMVDEAACAACDFNEPGKTCDRRMPWLWRGEYFPPKRSEVAMLRRRLQGEVFAGAGGAVRTYDQLGAEAQAGELRARVQDYSKKVYHRQRETRVEERQAVVCQRENPFYVDTVRSFRDRRYVYKGLLKASKQQQDAAAAAGDAAAVAAAKKLVVVYDSLQLAHKCILNSFYGYVMRKGARWHSLEMAGVVCLTGSRIIQMARQRVEQVGRPLELDTDGIWCALPRTFPENYTFALRGGGTFAISYPCTMLNHLVFDAFTNHQYQTRDGATGAYSVRAENSIFFEVDGPYRAMILPASKEADKLLKKRYAVFEHDGSLAELKGFEVKRRGELKLIKIFQSQIFGVFLQGDSLAACYVAVARVADQWLDILFSRARGLPDAELFDLITENRSMSKALDAYGGMKSTSICTARRLAEFLGDQMVKDKGLACKFVISRMPADQPVSERAVPVAIFAADAATRRLFLRRWLRIPQLGDADIRDILDWDYYLERFGSVIQKLITIPAAMQGVANPVPRIRHPDWLAKRVGAAASGHKQRQITDMFKKSAKSAKTDGGEDAGLDAAPDIEGLKAAEPDIEDLGRSAAPRPKTAVCRRPVRAEPAPDPARGYAAWLAHAKPAWRAWRRARALRGDGAEPEPDEGAFFSRTHVTLARSAWHVVQWAETDTPGELRAWAWVGGQLHGVRVAVPRTLYVASAVRSAQLGGSGYFAEARGMVLPRAAPGAPHLYRCEMPEAEFRARRASWSSFFAHPRIAGVYETELTALDRALIGLGAGARLTAQARRRGAGRSLGAAVALGDLAGVDAPGDTAGLAYALLYHAAAGDARQYFALVEPQAARARVWVVGAGAAQLPDVARLYRDARAAASVDGGAFAYPDALAVGVHAHATAAAAYRAVGQALAAARAERPATVLVCHAALAPRQLQARVRAIADFPTVAAAAAGDALPALDWARHASRRMVAALLGCAQWLGERIALARYADVPLGNLPADAPLFLADVFFARKLALARHVLWWSPSSVPDLGGRQHDEPAAALDADDALEFNAPGSYAAACAELEVRGLAVATVLKAPLVNEIEGAFGVFGFDAADPAPDGASDGPGPRDRAPDEPSPHMPAAASADNNVPAATFQLLRALLRDWCHAAEHSPFAAMMADHFYRWLTRPSALLHDPALARLVRSLMRKVFLQLKAECQRLGAKIVFASADRLIVTTGKAALPAAQAAVAYIVKALRDKPLFEHIELAPVQLWSYLLWMDAANYGGIVTQQQDADSGAPGEPRIEMLWNIKDYLPPVVQPRFELAVAEFIYKLASFHAQLRARLPHAPEQPDVIDNVHSDDDDDNSQSALAMKGSFYKRLIGQHFTRKLLAALPEIRQQCAPAHRHDAATLFPRLPGSALQPRADAALEFVKHVCAVFALDTPATNFVRVMRRNLLALLETGEFAPQAEFVSPCSRLVLPRVVCDACNYCRDMDFCRDADLLADAEWLCLGCAGAYDRLRIEERLIEQLHALLLAYQTQDLVCAKCRLMKQDNFSLQCTACAGKYATTISPDSVRAQVAVYLDVAQINRLTMLHDLASWVHSHTLATPS